MADRGTIIVTARVAYSCDHNKYSDLKFFSELRDGYRLISVILSANFPRAKKKKKLFWSKVLHCDTR